MAKAKWEYATMEWLWDTHAIRTNLPGGQEATSEGTYPEVVETLGQLGRDGWEIASCVACANWLFWTLKRAA